MIIHGLKLTNFKKHTYREFTFTDGSNMIIGPNYSGKTTILQAILVGLFGSSAVPEAASELVHDDASDFKIELLLGNLVITRSLRNSSILRSGEAKPYVLGHSAVNREVAELLGMDRATFLKVFASEQGMPQKLLSMSGSEFIRFIESILGIDQMDVMIKALAQEIRSQKDMAEGLKFAMLPEGEVTASLEMVSRLEASLAQGTEKLDTLETTRREKGCLADKLETKLAEVTKDNQAILHYEHTYKSLTDSLAALPDYEIDNVSNLSMMEKPFTEQVERKLEALTKQEEINAAWATYSSNKAHIEESLAALKPYEFMPEDTLATSVKDLSARHAAATGDLDKLKKVEARLAELEPEWKALLAGQPIVEGALIDTQGLEAKFQKQLALADALHSEYSNSNKAFNDSRCPECLRPYAEEDLSTAEHRLKELYAKLESALETKKVLEQELSTAKAHNATILQQIEAAEKHEALLLAADKAYQQLLAEQEALNALVKSHDYELLTGQLEKAKGELEAVRYNNLRFQSYKESLEHLHARAAKLVEPEGTRQDLTQFKKEYELARDILVDLKKKLEVAYEKNRIAQEIMDKEEELKGKLEDLVRPCCKFIDPAPLQEELSSLKKVANDILVDINLLNKELTETQIELARRKDALEKDKHAASRYKAHLQRADRCHTIHTIMQNSRTKFSQNAVDIVFKVTSEFSSMSTTGDISEVELTDDGIRYTEGDKTRSYVSASGAQKSIMGLGMKFGIASLVITPFSSLLLDEATADMRDDISLNCALAMQSLSKQVISISHRDMDVAGHVIDLGA